MAHPFLSSPFWAYSTQELLNTLDCSANGLSSLEAQKRLADTSDKKQSVFTLISHISQRLQSWGSPLLWLLVVAIVLAALLGQMRDAILMGIILMGSTVLTSSQEWRAHKALQQLQQSITLKTLVLRDQRWQKIPIHQVVPGDKVQLNSGDWVPADGIILDSNNLSVQQVSLTGEPQPVMKFAGQVAINTPLAQRSNSLFMGTSVFSGSANMLVVHTDKNTIWGQMGAMVNKPKIHSEFDKGIQQFSILLLYIVLIMIVVTLSFNQWQQRPVMDGLLFCLALAIGLSPEMLPAIVSITVARGAIAMSKYGVWVQRLEVMEDLGTMNVLCTDKTGTLTEGLMHLHDALDIHGQSNENVRCLGWINALLQSNKSSALDEALIKDAQKHDWRPPHGLEKIGEIGYDFTRQRTSIEIQNPDGIRYWITKGAFHKVADICSHIRTSPNKVETLHTQWRTQLQNLAEAQGREGLRILAIATQYTPTSDPIQNEYEKNLIFEGFVTFTDPPKKNVQQTLDGLLLRHVEVKMITGDQLAVAIAIAKAIGLFKPENTAHTLRGFEIDRLDDIALRQKVAQTIIFAQIEPQQKARIIQSLRENGKVVGYMGDGINDVPALHTAHVGISVDQAAQVARQSADVILTQNDLSVLIHGMDEGRRTFANTRKYLTITTSANLGNMLSMAVASMLLPFFPMSSQQILLNNLLSDIPAIFLSVEPNKKTYIKRAQRWDMAEFTKIVITLGLISSIFDATLFMLMLEFWNVSENQFKTGWFQFSLLTELLTILVLSTAAKNQKNRPSNSMIICCSFIAMIATALPAFSTSQTAFAFEYLPTDYFAYMFTLCFAYGLCIYWIKNYLQGYWGNNE